MFIVQKHFNCDDRSTRHPILGLRNSCCRISLDAEESNQDTKLPFILLPFGFITSTVFLSLQSLSLPSRLCIFWFENKIRFRRYKKRNSPPTQTFDSEGPNKTVEAIKQKTSSQLPKLSRAGTYFQRGRESNHNSVCSLHAASCEERKSLCFSAFVLR